jgi:hypothetical protein
MLNTRLAYFSDQPQDYHLQVKVNSTTGSEIVSTAEAKTFIRVDTTADDALIGEMITTARMVCENILGKDIVAKNRTLYTPFLNDRINLPFAPVASISSVTVDGDTATYKSKGLDKELIELDQLPAKEVKITYVTEGLTDANLEHAIKQLVSTYYDNRSEFITGTIVAEVPTNVKALLSGMKNVFI